MEENAQEATRKTKQSGKQHKYQHIPPVKIKTLFAYLEKLLYLCKSFCKKGGLRINGIQIGINRRAMHAIGYVKVFMWKVLQKSAKIYAR